MTELYQYFRLDLPRTILFAYSRLTRVIKNTQLLSFSVGADPFTVFIQWPLFLHSYSLEYYGII